VGIESAGARNCLASNAARLIGNGGTCPAPSGTTDPKVDTSVGDSNGIQTEIGASSGDGRPVREKFIIIVTLVVNETNNNDGANHVVKMFVDLIGPETPTATDREEVCAILKDALKKVDGRIPKGYDIPCTLDEKTTKKRDTSYVAALSFPASSNNVEATSASEVVVSVALIALSALAMLF